MLRSGCVLDDTLGSMLHADGFRRMTSPQEYERWVKFKLTTIAQLYELLRGVDHRSPYRHDP